MGKYKHEGKGRNISIGGGKQRSDLFKDMSGGYNAMGDSNSPNYKYNGSAFKQRFSSPMEKYGPLHGNAFGHAMQKAGGDYDKAKSMLEMKGSPMYKSGCVSGGSSKSPYKAMGDPNKKMDRLSAKHKSLYDRFEMGQTSEAEEQRMYRLEDRMDKVGKKIKKSKKSPLNQGTRSSKRQSRPDVSTLGEKEFLNSNSFGYPTDRTQLQESAKKRTSDPDYKKPKAKTLKKSPLNQGKKEMSKAEFKKAFEKKSKNPGDDPKLKKRLSTTQDLNKKKKDDIKLKNTEIIKATKQKMLQTKGKLLEAPLNQGRKVKKAAKTQAQIDKIRKSFGTKDADVSGRFERKRNKMDKTVRQLEKKGIKVDFDTTSAEGEGASRKTIKSPLNQGKKVKKAVRKAKKYIKAKESVKKQEEKGNYNSFREEGTKKAKRKVKKASKKHDKMRKAVGKLSTSKKKEALKTFKNK